MVPDYTVNDAWEDGYQVGYERGVLMALDHVCSTIHPIPRHRYDQVCECRADRIYAFED
jgi:hypothetical protein